MSSKSVITKSVGYFAIALSAWMSGMVVAGWFAPEAGLAQSVVFASAAAVLLAILAILSFVEGKWLDAIIFFTVAVLTRTDTIMIHAMAMGHYTSSMADRGWYDLIVAIFVFFVWLGALKSGWPRMIFLLATWLMALLEAIAGFGGGILILDTIAGYLGLISAIAALYYAAASVSNHGCGKVCLPTGSGGPESGS